MATIFALGAGSAQAQNFLMNSAETINKGNFKISAFPTVVLGEDGGENVVPGIEYRVAKDLDALAEIGLGLTDESPNYLSFGLSYYVR